MVLVGFQPWTGSWILIKWYIWSVYTKDLSNLKYKCDILKLLYKVQVCHETLHLLIFLLSGHQHVQTRIP